MKIGIDISQMVYENTGVSVYLKNLIEHLLIEDNNNQYVLFFSSLRRKMPELSLKNRNVEIRKYRFPPLLLDFFWNRLHILPIEKFIGDVDVFISSDWTQPPVSRAASATILYDLVIYRYPSETDKKIIATQRRRLRWVKKEADVIFCISEATKQDAIEIFNIDRSKLKVVYPGL